MATNDNPNSAPSIATGREPRAVTSRTLLLALATGLLGTMAANIHDGAIFHLEISQHNVIAPLAMTLLFLFMLLVNPVLSRLNPRWAFRSGELGVALSLALIATPISRSIAANWVSTIGFTQSLVDSQAPGFTALAKANLFEALPARAMLGPEDSRTFDDGVSPQIGSMAHPADIPWRVWLQPALYWAPLLLCFLALCISMTHLLYRQWAERELVPFPLAEIAADLLRRDRLRHFPDIFHVRCFWYGFGLMVFLFAINGIHAHVANMIEIPVKFSFYELSRQFPFLKNSLEGYSLLRGSVYFAIVAAAVLLPSEISFTAWFTWPVMVCCSYFYYAQTGQRFTGTENTMMMTGSFWAMALLILYAGRTYYAAIFRRALGLGAPGGGGVDAQSVRVCRLFLLAVLAFVAILVLYGIPADLAVIWTLALLMLFLVICRIVAEMGIPWTPLAGIGPLPFMLSVLGEKALGAKAYALMAILDNLTLNTTVHMVPAAAQAAHVEMRLRGRLSGAGLLAPFVVVMLIACVATAIWAGYSSEGSSNDYPARGFASINAAATSIQNLYLQGGPPPSARELLARDTPILERWQAVRLDPRFPLLFACGAAMILFTGFARLRFAWFPLHPLPLVLLGSWLMSRYFFSFFLGWMIKVIILKIGGGRLFERTKPFFTGAVTGLAVIYTFWIVTNMVMFRFNNFTSDGTWMLVFRDIFSG